MLKDSLTFWPNSPTNEKIEIDAGSNPPGNITMWIMLSQTYSTKLSSDMYPRQKLLQP